MRTLSIAPCLLALAGCGRSGPAPGPELIGIWDGPDRQLAITEHDGVRYRRTAGGSTRELGGRIHALAPDSIEVGLWPLTTTFHIDVPPHVVGTELRMTVDGVELVRQGPKGTVAPAAAPLVAEARPSPNGDPSLPALEEECRAGRADSCRRASAAYAVSRDFEKATHFGRAACDAGDAEGCGYLGNLLEMDSAAADRAAIEAAYQKACNGRFAGGCYNLGVLHQKDKTPEGNIASAKAMERACELGDAEGCEALGLAFLRGEGKPKVVEKAMSLFERACKQSPSVGCHELGRLYQGNDGVEPDEPRALELERKACTAGSLLGCHGLATLLFQGKSIPRDPLQAAVLFEKVCNTDGEAATDSEILARSNACHNLGALHTDGIGAAFDPKRAFELFTKACDLGDARSCHNLGLAYADGTIVATDLPRAAALFEKACAGEPRACTNLGVLCLSGKGVAQDRSKAMLLFRRACSGGSQAACENLKHPHLVR